jgi:nucleotide-binding universal stress UspA family protein
MNKMYKKILVPLDGSQLSESVLDHVVAIASGCKTPEVVLIRTRQPIHDAVSDAVDYEVASKLDESYQKEAIEYLRKVSDDLRKRGLKVETIVLSGKPAEEILNYAQGSGVDLIIMSSHGRSGVARWVLGSVADRVIRHSTVPVLVKPSRTLAA